jgi:hypothetical protein
LITPFNITAPASQAESRVRLLQLVSVVAEAAGEALRPHLGALAAALPQVWEAATATARRPDADTGSVARLHSALMAVLTHLVGKLRGAALEDAGVQGVLYPLLQYATDPGSSEADVLLEEALKLWAVVQGAQPTVSQQLVNLLPRMAALLHRGRDNTAAFQLIEGYLLLGGGAALQPYGEGIAAALAAALRSVSRTVAEACAPQQAPPQQQQPNAQEPHIPQQQQQQQQQHRGQGSQRGPLASEVTQEGLAAAALVDVFLQVRGPPVKALEHAQAHMCWGRWRLQRGQSVHLNPLPYDLDFSSSVALTLTRSCTRLTCRRCWRAPSRRWRSSSPTRASPPPGCR